MKKIVLISLVLCLSYPLVSQAQIKSKSYFQTDYEFIFSFASIDNNGNDGGNIMRFSGWFNLEGTYNYDFNKSFGIITGVALRNVGFIYNDPEIGKKKKYRTYNIGIPIGFKVGSMGKAHLYTGYEIEFPTNYKEKTFTNERKDDKFNVWFTSRTPAFYNTVFVGVAFKYGLSLKFKYYLSNFFNQDYSEINEDGETVYPYENIDVRIFYFSLNINLFTNVRFSYTKEELNKF